LNWKPQTLSVFASLVDSGSLPSGPNGLTVLNDIDSQLRAEQGSAALVTIGGVAIGFVPVLGDAVGVVELAKAIRAGQVTAIFIEGIGLVPVVGDVAKGILRAADDAITAGKATLSTAEIANINRSGSCLGANCNVCSFRGDTQVLTADGYRPIRDIRAGFDRVWSRDDITGRMSFQSVLKHYANPYPDTVYVTIRDLRTGAEQTIVSNRLHPFFVQRQVAEPWLELAVANSEGHVYRGDIPGGHWIDADQLRAGDRLLQSDEEWSEVVGVRVVREPLRAYNLTVANFSTYFVSGKGSSSDPVWVHNNCFGKQTGSLENPPSHMRAEEIASGYRLQGELGKDLRPLDNQFGGDFVDANGKIYDTMGMPQAYVNWRNGSAFMNQIDKHLLKSVDSVVIDVTGSSAAQRQQILDHLASHPNQAAVNAVIFVGN
jgi:Pretoxin HINT domain